MLTASFRRRIWNQKKHMLPGPPHKPASCNKAQSTDKVQLQNFILELSTGFILLSHRHIYIYKYLSFFYSHSLGCSYGCLNVFRHSFPFEEITKERKMWQVFKVMIYRNDFWKASGCFLSKFIIK